MHIYRRGYDVCYSEFDYHFLITDLKFFQIRLYSEGYMLCLFKWSWLIP